MNHNWWESLAEARREGRAGRRRRLKPEVRGKGDRGREREREREGVSSGSEERWRNKRVEAAMS